MICERSASSGACSENARRIGMSLSASLSMPGIQPTVEIVVRRWVMPTSGSRRGAGEHVVEVHHRLAHAHVHEVVTGSMRRKCSTWSRISLAVRLRPNFIAPVAQNVHVSGQPDCEETQIERRPSR